MLSPHRYFESLGAAVDDFAAVLATRNLSAPVPACPGWDLAALTAHLGAIHRWAHGRLTGDPRPSDAPGPDAQRQDWVAWLRAGAGELIAALAATDLDTACSTFGPPQTARFWLRRQAHETTMHRWDAQSTAGTPAPIDPDLAADGIREVRDVFLPRQLALGRMAALPGTLCLQPTDVGHPAVVLALFDAPFDAPAPPPAATVTPSTTVTGPASALLLALWKRVPPGAPPLHLEGDAAILAAPLTP